MPLLIIASLSYWALLIYTLSPQWSAYPQYNYGWAVPVLCAFLFWRQALERPQPSPARARRLNCLSIALLAILLLPTLIIQEANPIWRLASWTMALITVGITLGAIYAVGGRSWLRQFLFPCLYFLVAVPWPSALETWTIQTLTQWNAATTTEIVHWLGVPAIQRGNVIEVSTGVVGIDDACSGIRSFQATLMVSLFFGVVYRLSMSWRLGLVLSGFLFSFIFNAVRTSVMVVVAAKDGIPAIEKWHDPAGVTILLGCFTALWLLAMWLGRNQSAARTHAASGARFAVHTTPSRAFALSLIVWLGLTMVLAEAWFHFHRAGTDAAPRWSVVEPADRTSYREIPIDPYAREQLRFNEGFSFGWRESDGSVWQLVSFRWLPARELRRRVEVALAKSHRPEICIRATGCTIKEELPVTVISVNGLSLPFRRIQFDDSGRNLNVFYCVWDEDTPADATANMRENTMSRLRAAWTGNRTVGQRVLEVAVWGVADWKQAEAMLRVKLEQFVRVENSPPRPVHTIFR